MLFYPAVTLWVSRKNKYIFYLSKVERRTIHSDDYQEMGSKAEGSALTHESRIQRKCYSKEDYHFFLPLGKKILLMIISQISFCLNTERQKVQQYCHWSSLCSSWIEELPYLEQAYHLYAWCLLCFELLKMKLSRMRRSLLEQNLQIVNRSGNF